MKSRKEKAHDAYIESGAKKAKHKENCKICKHSKVKCRTYINLYNHAARLYKIFKNLK